MGGNNNDLLKNIFNGMVNCKELRDIEDIYGTAFMEGSYRISNPSLGMK